MLLAGCSSGQNRGAAPNSQGSPPGSAEASVGANVPQDDPSLSRVDAAGNTPEEVLLAYVRAVNSSDAKTAYSLHARGEGDLATGTPEWTEAPQPYEDFVIHEIRVTAADRALARVTYSTQGFSALSSETSLTPVVVSEPGEWWVIEKSDGLWKVTSKGPWD